MKAGKEPSPSSSSNSETEADPPVVPAESPPPPPPDPEGEDFLQRMFNDACDLRQEMEMQRPVGYSQGDFLVDPQATRYTWLQKKIRADGIRVEAYSADAKSMIEKHFKQKSATYTTERQFSELEATTLAFMYGHKLSYYLDIWRSNDLHPDFKFTAVHVGSYVMLEKHKFFIEHLDPGSNVPKRLQQYYGLKPFYL